MLRYADENEIATVLVAMTNSYPQRTHILRLSGPKTLLYKAFGLCLC